MGLFSSTKYWEPKQVTTARKDLLSKSQEDVGIPGRRIADLNDYERLVQELASDYIGAGQPNALLAEAGARAQEYGAQDPTQLPEFQAVMNTLGRQGERIAQSAGRGLQKTGNAPTQSTKGRDVLGRTVSDVQSQMMSAAVPFLQAERQRQFATIPLLEEIAQAQAQDKILKMDIGDRVSAKLRVLEQSVLDAEFNRAMGEIEMRYGTQASMLSSILGTNPGGFYEDKGMLSGISQLAGTVGDVTGAISDFSSWMKKKE